MASKGIKVGLVTGLAIEARALPPSVIAGGLMVELSAANPAQAERGARRLVEKGAKLLVSFGLAAGLNPRFGPGAVIVADRVLSYEGAYEVSSQRSIREQLNRLGSLRQAPAGAVDYAGGAVTGLFTPDKPARKAFIQAFGKSAVETTLVGVAHPIVSPAEKLGLLQRTEAFAADMESHIVGAVAHEAELPFLVVRVIGDPSNRSIPRSALAGFKDDGNIATGRLLAELAKRPWELFDLMSLAFDTRVALRSLRRVGLGLAPLLA